MTPTLYYDLGSPYAFLAVERAEGVLRVTPRLQPILLGAFFERRGYGSWALTEARERGQAEIEQRAASYGLPPLRWPPVWPPSTTLHAMRAALWATNRGAGHRFARRAFRAAFLEGASLGDIDTIAAVTAEAGLDAGEMRAAIEHRALKDQLRAVTEQAWSDGVRGVPTLRIGDRLFFGDDRLEAAAAALAPG
jgi:2-hydroxychromene-2-carboxylate isomerase